MRVRQLQLQGFKTFASKTTFQFDTGITAVVGPNGSGKSNLADALRWVLGEQSYSTMRSRRTEDFVFSGSSSRSPMGMAEVSLLLDNEDASLPVDFAEVEISRRAYRSGSNEYFLNRRRVRLQDVQDILGGLSSSYVVIHQGLVDEALSLRPRERRVLMEEAAEVRRYHERRQKAQEQLDRTEANMTRISDLRSELTPRLRSLQRQSQQARQWARTEAALQQALRDWYRLLWEEASAALRQAQRQEEESRGTLEQARSSLETVVADVTCQRRALQQAQRQREELRRQESDLRRREETMRQEMAQAEGERRALQRYAEELQKEITHWQREASGQEERDRELEGARQSLEQRAEQAAAALGQQEAALERAEARLDMLRRQRQDMEERWQAREEELQQRERRLEVICPRLDALKEEAAERTQLLEELTTQQQLIAAAQATAEEALSRLEAEEDRLTDQEEEVRQEVARQREELHQAGEALEQARWQLAEWRARLEALLQEGTPGEAASFLQRWADEKGRPAFRRLLSKLDLPPELEPAVEAALGAAASALLTADWEDATAALDALIAAEAGQATLLPQNELRPPDPSSAPPTHPDAEGPLLDALSFPESDRPAASVLLGHTLLASDLAAARRVAQTLPPAWSVVTRQGQVVTAGGALRGGRVPPEQSALARERERRERLQAVHEAEEKRQQKEETYSAIQQQLAQREQILTERIRQREARQLQREEHARQLRELEREGLRLQEEAGRQRTRLDTLNQELQSLAAERLTIEEELPRWREQQAELQQRLDELRLAEQLAQAEATGIREQLQQTRTLCAVVQKERENQQALEEMIRRNAERLQQQIAEAEARLQDTRSQIEDWETRIAALSGHLEQLTAIEVRSTPAVEPLPVSLDELTLREEEAAQRRQEVLELEARSNRATIEVERQQERLKEVLRRGLAEVGPEASAYGLAGEALLGALLENPPEWTHMPVEPQLPPEELERRIGLLREEIRRIGPVNPLAEQEHRDTEDRYKFLGDQLQDLQDAARSLRQVIVELDQTMEDRFRETFRAINQEFQAYFSRLFSGGTAQLRLERYEEREGGLADLGVEIVARPPGKRAHSLALLSGGERALTSAALLFAILKVNPRPFCLLDEVDAMLDEANLGRFRECLEELAAETQFIVITHNRSTVESANTLYGVSLAQDGTSHVLSLRLEELEADKGRGSE